MRRLGPMSILRNEVNKPGSRIIITFHLCQPLTQLALTDWRSDVCNTIDPRTPGTEIMLRLCNTFSQKKRNVDLSQPSFQCWEKWRGATTSKGSRRGNVWHLWNASNTKRATGEAKIFTLKVKCQCLLRAFYILTSWLKGMPFLSGNKKIKKIKTPHTSTSLIPQYSFLQ